MNILLKKYPLNFIFNYFYLIDFLISLKFKDFVNHHKTIWLLLLNEGLFSSLVSDQSSGTFLFFFFFFLFSFEINFLYCSIFTGVRGILAEMLSLSSNNLLDQLTVHISLTEFFH